MNWKTLDNSLDLPLLMEESTTDLVLIFKHSTRCSISAMALSRFERAFALAPTKFIVHFYMIEVVEQRPISNLITTHFGIEHQSPQVLLIYKNKAVYSVSHNGISYQDICSQAQKVT